MLKKRISEYGFIAVGALILALGLQLFMVPSKLTTGGVSGLATVFYYYFKIPLSVTVFSVNLLLMLFAVRSFSLSALLKNFKWCGGGIAAAPFFGVRALHLGELLEEGVVLLEAHC